MRSRKQTRFGLPRESLARPHRIRAYSKPENAMRRHRQAGAAQPPSRQARFSPICDAAVGGPRLICIPVGSWRLQTFRSSRFQPEKRNLAARNGLRSISSISRVQCNMIPGVGMVDMFGTEDKSNYPAFYPTVAECVVMPKKQARDFRVTAKKAIVHVHRPSGRCGGRSVTCSPPLSIVQQ